jgi:hypothetical protein
MLRFLLQNLLHPAQPKQTEPPGAQGQACNVVGGCGAGCLCVPDQSAPSTAPQRLDTALCEMAERGQIRPRTAVPNLRDYDPVTWGH